MPVEFTQDTKPVLCVGVDTEAEWDWHAPFSRDGWAVTAIREIWRLHDVLRARGITPTYFVDYPVATTPEAAERLAAMAREGGCQIGAHLHPWVTPPFREELTVRNSFGCNLGAALETEKIRELRNAVTHHLGIAPRSYRAGRFGFGETTAAAIEALGFDVDSSVNGFVDFSTQGGPPRVDGPPKPAWFGRARRLLEVPDSSGFVGFARRSGPAVHAWASSGWLKPTHAVGVLARAGVVNRVFLGPEICTGDEMRALTEALYGDGLRVFGLTIHSTSLKPGCTPYVSNDRDRERLIDRVKAYCDYFLERLGGEASTPVDLYDRLTTPQRP